MSVHFCFTPLDALPGDTWTCGCGKEFCAVEPDFADIEWEPA